VSGSSIREELERLVEEFSAKLARARLSGSYVEDGDYDRFKYMLAKMVARLLASTSCVERIYYADLASGEFISQQQYYGRDLDILVVSRGPPCRETLRRLAARLEKEFNTLIASTASRLGIGWLAHVARTNGVLEVHVDDEYAQAIRHKELKGLLSDTNAIPLL